MYIRLLSLKLHVKSLLFLFILFLACLLALSSSPVVAQSSAPTTNAVSQETIKLNKDLMSLKEDIVELNRELYQFEEDLLHPVETQVAVFLALEPKTRFSLDSIELQLNDTLISSYLYQEKEIAALRNGGIQQLYVGSLSDGKHKLTASFNGQGASSRYFKRKKAMKFVKGQNAKYIQMIVSEDPRTGEPLFKVKQW